MPTRPLLSGIRNFGYRKIKNVFREAEETVKRISDLVKRKWKKKKLR